MNRPLRVLIVDDSAYIRKVVKEMLSRESSIEVVGTARDGEDALELVERLQPDVVTCDLIMPGVGGVEFIRRQMAVRPVPIVIVSIAAESSERVLSGLDAGAIDLRSETDRARHREGATISPKSWSRRSWLRQRRRWPAARSHRRRNLLPHDVSFSWTI